MSFKRQRVQWLHRTSPDGFVPANGLVTPPERGRTVVDRPEPGFMTTGKHRKRKKRLARIMAKH